MHRYNLISGLSVRIIVFGFRISEHLWLRINVKLFGLTTIESMIKVMYFNATFAL